LVLIPAAFCLLLPRPWNLLGWLACGVCWTGWHAVDWLEARAAADALPDQITVVGTVTGIARPAGTGQRVDFRPESLIGPTTGPIGPHARWRVYWFNDAAPPDSGARWRLTLRFRRSGTAPNPGSTDHERHLFRHGISASAIVLSARREAQRPASIGAGLSAIRGHYARRLNRFPVHSGTEGLLAALAVGERGGISRRTWSRYRDSGTAHLLAISGLHITLVAALGMLVGRLGWRVWASTPRAPTRRDSSLPLAFVCAAAYAALAGFSLPTTRALIMLLVPFAAFATRRRISISHGLALACLGVLVLDPAAPLDPGFWLSFMAVSLILAAMGRRQAPSNALGDWVRIQAFLFVGLLPVTLAAFGRLPLASLPANLIAIPWVSLTAVPATLAGVVLQPVAPDLAAAAWHLADWCLAALNLYLDWVNNWLPALVVKPPGPAALFLALCGVGLLAAPRGLPGRWLGGVLLCALLQQGSLPPTNTLAVTVLQSPRALVVAFDDGPHTLLYGAGARTGPGTDSVTRIVLPYLKNMRQSEVGWLVLGSAAAGQRGGIKSLLDGVKVGHILVPAAFPWPVPRTEPCRSGPLPDRPTIRLVRTAAGGLPGCGLVLDASGQELVVAVAGLSLLLGQLEQPTRWLLTTPAAATASHDPDLIAAVPANARSGEPIVGKWSRGRWCVRRIQETGPLRFHRDAEGRLHLESSAVVQDRFWRRPNRVPPSSNDRNPVSCRPT
jgi:competence protein ComEC